MFQVVWREPTSPRLFAFGATYDVAPNGLLGRRTQTQTGEVEPARFTREGVDPFRAMPAMFSVESAEAPSEPSEPSAVELEAGQGPGSDDDQNPAAGAHERRRRR